MSSKYRKFGLRRDRNLSDLPNPQIGLNNLLDGLAVSGETFVSDDLFVINGIRNTPVRNQDFRELSGTLVQFTPEQGGSPQLVTPLVTIQDNIDNYKSVLGDLPFLAGGDGPKTFFASSALLRDQSLIVDDGETDSLTGDDVFDTQSESLVGPEDFWEDGNFSFGDKLYPTFADGYGAVQWVGYLSTVTSIRVLTTGLFIVEQDQFDDGNWTTFKSVYDESRQVTVTSTNFNGSNTIVGVGEDVVRVCIGDSLQVNQSEYDVVSVNHTEQTITVVGDITGVVNTGDTVSVVFNLENSEQIDSNFFQLFSTSIYGLVKTRITLWWPVSETGLQYENKLFTVDGRGRSPIGDDLPFNYFYSENQSSSVLEDYTFKYFIENRLSETQQNIDDHHIQTTQSILVDYQPNTLLADNILSSSNAYQSIRLEGGGRITGDFSSLDIGDWIVYQQDSTLKAARVDEKNEDDVVFVDPTEHGNVETVDRNAIFVRNIGLVGIYQFDSSNSQLIEISGTSFPVNEAKVDNMLGTIAFESGTPTFNTEMLRISSRQPPTSNTINVTVDNFLPGSSETVLSSSSPVAALVYSHSGLSDYSGESQCVGVYGRELTSQASSGNTSIILSTTNGIEVGDFVQYGEPGSYLSIGTTVSSVVDSNEITISDPVVQAIPQNATMIFIEQQQGDPGTTSKEFCVLPLNTAPPFFSTDTGLSTSLNYPDLTVNNLAFTSLEIKSLPSNNVNDTTTSDTNYSQYVSLQHDGNTYKLLIK